MTWNGAGAWLIFSQSRQVNFSRTCWITFHCRGITSRVSVMSSPNLRRRGLPQHRQTVGPGSITRSRGRCSGKGWRAGRLRIKATTLVVLATARSAAISSRARLSHTAAAPALLNPRVSQSVAAPDQVRGRLSAGHLRTPGANWVPPVDPVKHVSQLRRADRDAPVGRRRPDKTAALQSLGVERHANAVMPDDLD